VLLKESLELKYALEEVLEGLNVTTIVETDQAN